MNAPLTDAAFRVLVEHAADLIVVADPAGVVRYVSPSAARLGYAGGWEGRAVADVVHPDDRAAVRAAFPSHPAECRLPLAAGGWRHVEAVATDLRSEPAVGGLMIDFRDVSARKQAEAQLQALNADLEHRAAERAAELADAHRQMAERASRHRAIFEGTSHLVYIKDLDGRFLLANPATAAFFGRPVEEVIGKTDAELMDPACMPAVAALDRRAREERTVRADEEEVTVGGEVRYFVSTKGPYYDAGGNLAGVFGISRDVTDRKRAEDAAKAAADLLRSVTASIPGVVYRLRIDLAAQRAAHDFVSDGILDLAGIPPAEAVGDAAAFINLIHPDDRPGMERVLLGAIESGAAADVEYRLRHRGGALKWVRGRFRRSGQAPGGALLFDGFALDITAQKQAEQAVRENDAKFRALFEGTSAGVAVVDVGPDAVLDCNEAFLGMLRCRREEVVGRPTRDFAAPVQAGGLTRDELRARNQPEVLAGRGAVREIAIRRPDGTEFPAEFVLNPFALGGRPAVLAIVSDISARKRGEEALRQAAQAAEAANRAKSEFLAHMSHEIRTPMNGILGLTELALESGPPPEQREYLELVRSSAEALLAILNDLLDLSKIEAGKLDLEHTPFSLRRVVDEAVRPFSVQARGKGLALATHIPDDVPDALAGDPVRLRQVLVNLVGNAVKFTARGSVFVEVRNGSPPEACTLRFEVADTGIGIPAEQQRRIFQPFEQADGSTTRRYGGTGLGLTIAARLAAMLGGEIGVRSEPGHGSTFTFTARFAAGPAAPPAPPRAAAPDRGPHPLRVLLAEDHEVNQLLARRLLERRGHTVAVAADGRAALAALEAGGFDLALLDVQMPELDGLEVVARFRRREHELKAGRLPVLALTAFSMKGDRERCLAAGMDGYLSKPIRAAELYAAIDRVAAPPPRPAAGSVLDPAAILGACAGDQELLDEIAQVFRDRAPALVEAVRGAVARRDAPALARAAHACKGVVATFSAVAADAARRLEQMGQADTLDGAEAAAAELDEVTRRLATELAGVRVEALR